MTTFSIDGGVTLAGNTVGPVAQAKDNLAATTDPGSANDTTQGYAAGSIWINTTAFRVWICQSAAASAAVWLLDGVQPGVGVEPANMLTQFGGSAFGATFGAFTEEGNLYRNIGNPIAGNGADTTDDIIGGIALPAGAFDVAGRGLCITAQGKLGSTGNNKRIRLWINPIMSGQVVTAGVIAGGTVTGAGSGVLAVDSGTQTGNAVGWSVLANFFKYGAGGSNTQYVQGSPITGASHGGISAPAFTAFTESAAMNIVVTGASQTTGAANDVVLNFLEVNAMN
jgi:hypothetical protein